MRLGLERRSFLVSALASGLSGCRGELSGGHATEVPGFFAYSHQQIRRYLRAGGYSDQLTQTPDRAVRRSAGHEAIICLTRQTGDARVLASIWSAGAATRTVSLESEMIYLDAAFRPVAPPGGRFHRTDPTGRYYVDQVGREFNIAQVRQIDRPGIILAETKLMTWYVFYVFSTEKRVFLFGPQHEKDDGCNWCLLVAQRIDHEDSRRDEWFLIDLNTGGCKNLGRFSSCDFGFVLKAEPFGNSVS